MITIPRPTLGTLALCLCLAPIGCSDTGPDELPTDSDRVNMLSLMLPERIEIWPGTRIDSFDDDPFPDGVLVIVRPQDAFGDPVKAAGRFYFELWEFQPASGEPRGERLAFWSQLIDSTERVEEHWTQAQMFEFRLGWPEETEGIRPGRKYVLKVTYHTPWDKRITDQIELDFLLPGGAARAATSP